MKINESYGPWALITGASSGIGEQFARQLSEQGLNLVLVARRESVLNVLARELTDEFGINVVVVAADLATDVGRNAVKKAADELEIGLLINNAGVEQSGSFFRYTSRETTQLVDLNVTAPVDLAHHFGRQMVSRGRGGILFVASALGYQGVPWYANYAASKATLVNLAESLHYELKPLGVDVLALSPGITHTPMAERLNSDTNFASIGLRALSPRYVARVGLRNLGRRATVVPGIQYKAFGWMTKWLLPRSTSAWMFGKLMSRAFRNKSAMSPIGNTVATAGTP
ncbi:MAG: SDR family NAD(P)-dependent oxidoreductase [Pirellulaceae bacterium]